MMLEYEYEFTNSNFSPVLRFTISRSLVYAAKIIRPSRSTTFSTSRSKIRMEDRSRAVFTLVSAVAARRCAFWIDSKTFCRRTNSFDASPYFSVRACTNRSCVKSLGACRRSSKARTRRSRASCSALLTHPIFLLSTDDTVTDFSNRVIIHLFEVF